MSFEAYSVAVRLKLIDGVSTGLVAMAGQFSALNNQAQGFRGHLTDVEQRLTRLKTMGLIGGAAVTVGGLGLSLFSAPIEEAKKFQTEVARFASLGFGDKVTRDAEKFAVGMKTYGTSALENMTLVSDAMAVFKDLHHSEMAAPIMARMRFANQAVFGDGGKPNESKFMDMLKVIEFRRGLSSPAEFETQANFVQKVISGSRNRVDASQLLAALKTGGVALSQLSNQAFYLGSEPLIQEFGGQRYGTGMMSIYQNLVQGRTTSSAAAELARLGLLDPKGVELNSLGGIKKFKAGSFLGSEVLEKEGLLALLNKVLLPAFAAKGITGEEAVIRELGLILTNRTGSSLSARAYQQRGTLAMQIAANASAQDINQLDASARNTLAGKEVELHAKWRDVLRELGTAVLPIAIKAVQGLTGVVTGIVAFAREFPALTKALTVGFGVLAGIVAVGGVLTLATAGFKALGLALLVSKGAGMGSALLEVAGGLGAVGGVLGKMGLVGAAGAAGYLGAKALGADKLGEWIGGKVYDMTHWDSGASRFGTPMYSESNWIAGAKSLSGGAPMVVNMDGRKVGEIVSGHQAKAANRPQAGGAGFDGRLALTPAGGY